MFWLVLILGVIGVGVYLIDKKIKGKFKLQDEFNPKDWDIPESLLAPADVKPQAVLSNSIRVEKIIYTKKDNLLSPEYESLYKALRDAVTNEFNILTNINVADVLTVASNSNALGAQVAIKNLSGKQFDFILCEKQTLAAVCVISINDSLESFLIKACESAALPILNLKTQMNYDADALREKFFQVLSEKANPPGQAIKAQLDGVVEESQVYKISDPLEIKSDETVSVKSEVIENGIDLKLCPKCSAVMLKRKAKTGASAGKLFWICSTYPECRGMKEI